MRRWCPAMGTPYEHRPPPAGSGGAPAYVRSPVQTPPPPVQPGAERLATLPHVSLEELRGALLELGVTTFGIRMVTGPSGSFLVAQIPLRDHPADYAASSCRLTSAAMARAMAQEGGRPSLVSSATGPPPRLTEDPVLVAEPTSAALLTQLAALERMVGSMWQQVLGTPPSGPPEGSNSWDAERCPTPTARPGSSG